MISASHNPPEYNALKFFKKGGMFLSSKDIKKLSSYLGKKISYSFSSEEIFSQKEAYFLHKKSLLQEIPYPKKRFRIAIDTMGGSTTYIVKELLEEIGMEVLSLYEEELPKFPRVAEPKISSLKKFSLWMKEKKADIGFAYDPDGDRMAILLKGGKPLSEEYTLALFLYRALSYREGDVVINLSTSYLSEEIAKKAGRKVFRTSVGEYYVVKKMKEKKALLGGEGNGGVIDFKIPSYGRDGLCATLWILSLLEEVGDLEELINQLPKYSLLKVTIPWEKEWEKEKWIEKISSLISSSQVFLQDGIYVRHKEGLPWIHVRPSNTEPILRIFIEASHQKESRELKKKLLSLFQK